MSDWLDLHTVRIVQAVAEHGTLTAAAAALGYSQPALSQHLRRTERRLGAALVVRSGRRVRLTEAGATLAGHAGAVLGALRAAEQDLDQLVATTTGTVRVVSFPSASSTVVPRLIAALGHRHPGLRVVTAEAEPPEALAALARGDADVAVTFSYPGDPTDPHREHADLLVTDLFDEPVALALPAGHPAAGRADLRLADLADERWIAGCPLCRGHLLAACEAAGFAPRIDYETDNAAAVLGLVAVGAGVAFVPRLALNGLAVPDQVRIRAERGTERRVHAVVVPGSGAIPAVAAALTALEGAALPA